MSSRTFLWIEDRKDKAGCIFWETLLQQLFPDVIIAREKLVKTLKSGSLSYKNIQEVMDYDDHLNEHNIEQLAAKLLFDLTRNAGFEVSKSHIGDCWIKSCCGWTNRQANDICGLDDGRLSISDKMKSIYAGTSLNEEFPKVGLEVSMC